MRFATRVLGLAVLLAATAIPARAGSHLWIINEVFSNADGTIQFVEMYNPTADNEINIGGLSVFGDGGVFHTFPNGLPPNSTADRYMLLATTGFTSLPGVPTPDHIIPDNSISMVEDLIQFHVYQNSILSYAGGQLPLDGAGSWNTGGAGADFVAVNSPTNFAGESGSVNLAAPPAVPDGSAATTPMTATKLTSGGGRVRLFWDTSTCADANDHRILFGEGFPLAPGGVYTLGGAKCDVGATSPYDWVGTPTPQAGGSLVWWLMVTGAGTEEGSWGRDGAGVERSGPGAGGASALCGATDKNLGNACGR